MRLCQCSAGDGPTLFAITLNQLPSFQQNPAEGKLSAQVLSPFFFGLFFMESVHKRRREDVADCSWGPRLERREHGDKCILAVEDAFDAATNAFSPQKKCEQKT